MIILFFTVAVLLFCIIIYVISYLKWIENKKTTAMVAQKAHKLFTDVKVSSVSYSRLKSSMGFQVKAQLFLFNDFLIITAREMSVKLFHTTLPLVLKNKKGTISKVKMTSWNTVQIAFQKNTLSLGKATIELTIETKNNDGQLAIFNEIKEWT